MKEHDAHPRWFATAFALPKVPGTYVIDTGGGSTTYAHFHGLGWTRLGQAIPEPLWWTTAAEYKLSLETKAP